MTEALKALFALFETEEDDFALLVQRFGIDPATDLQNCDLTNVDFGSLAADTLNLTGSDIEGANLSKVRCKHILGAAGEVLKIPHHGTAFDQVGDARFLSRPLIDAVVLAVSRYQNPDWTIKAIVNSFNDSAAPILAFYDSSAEQDVLTKRLCSILNDLSGPLYVNPDRAKFVWFYSKAEKSRFELKASSLEQNFFDLLRSDRTSDDIGVYPYLSNREAVNQIKEGLEGSYDKMRGAFARKLVREMRGSERRGVVLFSGYPPVSRRLYQDIRSATNQPIKLIFLCSSKLEDEYKSQPVEWKRLVIPTYAVGQPQASNHDVERLGKRVEMASRGKISFGGEFQAHLQRWRGKPLVALKQEIIDRLRHVASALPMYEMNIDDVVL